MLYLLLITGESVEENANLVVRLLIRRPECLGPALRGEGGGLLKAMHDGILMSLQIAAARDDGSRDFLKAVYAPEDDDRGNFLQQRSLVCRLLFHNEFRISLNNVWCHLMKICNNTLNIYFLIQNSNIKLGYFFLHKLLVLLWY